MFLQVSELSSGYAGGIVVAGADLELDRGEVLGLLGRNGVGKTTLLMTLMGLLPARGGSVRLDGRELVGQRTEAIARAGLALIPQGRRIWPGLTVAEHLDLVAAARRGQRAGGWTRDGIYALLPQLGRRERHAAGLLSGGEQQMLAIARALLTNPALVLMDEPSEGLAPTVVSQVGGVIESMATSGVAVLLVEQDLHLAFRVARRVAVMQKGEIVHTAGTETFRRQPELAERLLGVS